MEGNSNRLYVFESPIDALSHATLSKLKDRARPGYPTVPGLCQ